MHRKYSAGWMGRYLFHYPRSKEYLLFVRCFVLTINLPPLGLHCEKLEAPGGSGLEPQAGQGQDEFKEILCLVG
jgi:hypothetical protein